MAPNPEVLNKMRGDAAAIFNAGLEAVAPDAAVKRFLRKDGNYLYTGDSKIDLEGIRNIYIVGAGKASAAMGRAAEAVLGNLITDGVICVKYGHVAALDRIRLVEAGHPVPDESGRKGAEKLLALLSGAGEDDLVICLISGGGSALTPLPAPGLTLADKQRTTEVLLGCGATIHEINTIRKHISGIKGGRLARAAYPARLVSLILSDVVGDDLDVIASGPTVPDGSRFQDCMAIVQHYGILDQLPDAVADHLQAGVSGEIPETPGPGDSAFSQVTNLIVGSNMDAIRAARVAAEKLGYQTLILSSLMEGETREVARVHTAIAREVLQTGNPVAGPACLLSGGETTVTLRGNGKGGRNQEFALAAALDIANLGDIVVFSAGTDGTDGPTDAAGAVVDGLTVPRASVLGMSPRSFLMDNNAYPFFSGLKDLVMTGPTHTNVMDLRIVLVGDA